MVNAGDTENNRATIAAEKLGRFDPAMAGNDLAIVIDQDRVVEPKALDAEWRMGRHSIRTRQHHRG